MKNAGQIGSHSQNVTVESVIYCFILQEKSVNEVEQLKIRLKDSEAHTAEVQSWLDSERSDNVTLKSEVARLKLELESERTNKADAELTLEKEKTEKDSALLRSAKISQEIYLSKQELKKQESENSELRSQLEQKIKELNECNEKLTLALQRVESFQKINKDVKTSEGNEKALKTSLSDMEEQLNEKTKVIF